MGSDMKMWDLPIIFLYNLQLSFNPAAFDLSRIYYWQFNIYPTELEKPGCSFNETFSTQKLQEAITLQLTVTFLRSVNIDKID